MAGMRLPEVPHNTDWSDTPYADLPMWSHGQSAQMPLNVNHANPSQSFSSNANNTMYWAPDPQYPHVRIPMCRGIDYNAPPGQLLEQLDQRITFTMQELDSTLSRLYTVFSARLVPAVKKYAQATEPVRQSAQSWTRFFETAAHVRVPDMHRQQYADDNGQYADGDGAEIQESYTGTVDFGNTSATPQSSSVLSSITSPFDRLKHAADEFERATTPEEPTHDEGQRTKATPLGANYRAASTKGAATPKPLLQRVLKKAVQTPKAAENPFGGKNWNGLVDLRQPSPSTNQIFAYPNDDDEEESTEFPAGWSPLRTTQFVVPLHEAATMAGIGQTPAKEYVRNILKDYVGVNHENVDPRFSIGQKKNPASAVAPRLATVPSSGNSHSSHQQSHQDASFATSMGDDSMAIAPPQSLQSSYGASIPRQEHSMDSDSDSSMRLDPRLQGTDDTLFGRGANAKTNGMRLPNVKTYLHRTEDMTDATHFGQGGRLLKKV